MVESIMYFGLGFCLAGLTVLIVVPLAHGRAVRLTTRQLETSIPSSLLEVLAEKDLQRAEFAMSTRRLERKVEQLKAKNARQLAELGRKTDAINRLKTAFSPLRDQLHASEGNSAVNAKAAREAEHALSDKQLELAKLTRVLAERSVLVDLREAENAALTMQVEALKQKLSRVGDAAEEAVTHKLMEERMKFENFHGRVADLVQQVVARTRDDKSRYRRVEEDLERRVFEQSRLLNERNLELKQLRDEIESARKAEYDLRAAMIEIDGRANVAAQNFNAENARLQAMLERANGERVRLTYELANIKRLAKETKAA